MFSTANATAAAISPNQAPTFRPAPPARAADESGSADQDVAEWEKRE